MASVSKQFAMDFDLWADSLRADGEPEEGIAEIKDAIRNAFAVGGDSAEYWKSRVSEEAEFIRGLQTLRTRVSV